MLNFTVGPVQMDKATCLIGAEQVPYFRTPEFSEIMMENEKLMLEFTNAPDDSRAVFITGSGTAAMEATVMNAIKPEDKVLVINGGSFGQRFVDLCQIHQKQYRELKLEFGRTLTEEQLNNYKSKGITTLLVNIHETSSGVLYDIEMISRFCKENNVFLIVDAISAFLADPLDLERSGIGIMITGSQKALACPPGVSVIVLSPEAIDRINQNTVSTLYFDLKNALKQGERGQTPFTPSVGTLLQIHNRLVGIKAKGGVDSEIKRVKEIADDFRKQIGDLPLAISSDCLSNAVTPLHPFNASAHEIFIILKDEYDIWVCPNGGEYADEIFRVGHIGNLTFEDNAKLIGALKDLRKRNLL